MSDARRDSPRLLDRHFRWRSTGASRLEGFCDAVFAIVLALLFLRAAPPESFGQLETAMKSLVPFAAMFTIVAYVWVEHWLFSRRYDLNDGWAKFLQLLLLFLLLAYAYPLKFLFTGLAVGLLGPLGDLTVDRMLDGFDGPGDMVRLFVFYGAGYGALFLVLGLLHVRALQLAGELRLDRVERFLTRSAILQCLLQVAVAAASIGCAVAGLGLRFGLPGWLYCAIGPLMWAHGSWQGRRLERLRAA